MKPVGCLATLLVLTGLVHADTFAVSAAERGWVCSDADACIPGATNNGSFGGNNYVAGNSGIITRNWFEFAIPTLTGGSLVSATLELYDLVHTGGDLTYTVYGLSGEPLVMSDVSTSNAFGSVGTSSASTGIIVDITLNAAALAAIGAAQGGNIFIGGIDSGELASGDAYDFGVTGPQNSTILSLETGEQSPVPEPASWLLFAVVPVSTAYVTRKRFANPS